MKLGIMQPYLFPYIGYWQLLAAVDKYVIYDDVNFIKGGWINRNRILNNGKVQYFNVQLKGSSSYKHINEIEIQNNEIQIVKNKKTLYNAYHKSKMFNIVFPMLEGILEYNTNELAAYLENSIKNICKYLEIDTELVVSSHINKDDTLKGEDKVIEICRRLGADTYYNAIGGRSLYDFEHFKNAGIKLIFLKTKEIQYDQNNQVFEPNLSIIDVLMNNSKDEVRQMLKMYELIGK